MSVLKRILAVLAIIILVILIVYGFAMILGRQILYPDFIRIAEKGVGIPALSEGFTPQGVSYLDVEGCTLICGYYPGNEASRIFMVYNDGHVKEIPLRRENRDVYTGHAGGLTAAGEYVYVSNASKLFVLRIKDLLDADDGEYVSFIGYVPVPCRASFCGSDGEYVYVGDYHADGYETDESHRIQTVDGEYQAMVFAFKLNSGMEFGVEMQPSKAFAVRDFVQGFSVTGNTAVMSCSHSFSASNLYTYDIGKQDGTFTQDCKEIPLYILDSRKQTGRLKMPHMSEDIEIRGDSVLIGFESSAKKMLSGFVPCSIRNVMIVPLGSVVQ
jgi:hypothetical protein